MREGTGVRNQYKRKRSSQLGPQDGRLKARLVEIWPGLLPKENSYMIQYSTPSFKELFALRRIQVEDEPRKRCYLTHPYNRTFGLTHSILFYVTCLLNQTSNKFKRFIYKI